MAYKAEKIGTIRDKDLKVRKKQAPPTQVQKSPKDYDRKRLKDELRKIKQGQGDE